jgi:hypothetical protein
MARSKIVATCVWCECGLRDAPAPRWWTRSAGKSICHDCVLRLAGIVIKAMERHPREMLTEQSESARASDARLTPPEGLQAIGFADQAVSSSGGSDVR